jgi:hypothetical protein
MPFGSSGCAAGMLLHCNKVAPPAGGTNLHRLIAPALPGAVYRYITKSDSSGTTHSGGSPRATRCTLS